MKKLLLSLVESLLNKAVIKYSQKISSSDLYEKFRFLYEEATFPLTQWNRVTLICFDVN